MSSDLLAYFPVYQEELEDYIERNNLDRYDFEHEQIIANYYKDKYLDNTDFEPHYSFFNGEHHIYVIYQENEDLTNWVTLTSDYCASYVSLDKHTKS